MTTATATAAPNPFAWRAVELTGYHGLFRFVQDFDGVTQYARVQLAHSGDRTELRPGVWVPDYDAIILMGPSPKRLEVESQRWAADEGPVQGGDVVVLTAAGPDLFAMVRVTLSARWAADTAADTVEYTL